MIHYWKKLGQVYALKESGRHPKLISHAANPLPLHLYGDIYRVFYSGRDERNRSSVGAVDIDIVQLKVMTDHYEPFFEHGPEGSFYADGVSIGCSYSANDQQYILFMGWREPSDGHWRGNIGRLIVDPNITLRLDNVSPFLGFDSIDPISLSYPWVIEESKYGYLMFYGSTKTWDAGNGEMIHTINYASSYDGNLWARNGLAIPFEIGIAQAFSRPTVIKNNEKYHMWFSYRSGSGEKYRIGYSESTDAINWTLDIKNAGINVSEVGWDSQMIEYPFVFKHSNDIFMLYNGNDYGKTGFGLAVLQNY